MSTQVYTHLMFQGQAAQAIELYLSAFEDSELLFIEHFSENHESHAGQVNLAKLRIKDAVFLCIDSPAQHNFTFTPSMSIFIEFSDESEMLSVLSPLAEQGEMLMPLDNYGFSEKFVWFIDRFGVSWQLNLR